MAGGFLVKAEAKSRSNCIFPEGFGLWAQRGHDGFKPAVAPHLDLRCGRGVGEKFRPNEPGGLAVREQVVGLVEELEGRPCGTSWMFGPDGHRAEDVGQWPDYVVHDAYGHIRERADLLRR